MANYFLSYDLNGPRPSHAEMDKHLESLGYPYGRVLETVWYVSFPGSAEQLLELAGSTLGSEDLLLVIEARNAAWTRLLVDTNSLLAAWQQAA